MPDLDPIARRIARFLPRDPPVSDKVAQRLEAARVLAVRQNRKRRRARAVRAFAWGTGIVFGVTCVGGAIAGWFGQ